MAKLTWLGEDEAHAPAPGPSFCIWFDIKFPKDQEIEVSNPECIGLAKVNRYFKVVDNETQESKAEEKEKKEYNFREAETGSGYTPVKKKVRKPKPKPADVPF